MRNYLKSTDWKIVYKNDVTNKILIAFSLVSDVQYSVVIEGRQCYDIIGDLLTFEILPPGGEIRFDYNGNVLLLKLSWYNSESKLNESFSIY